MGQLRVARARAQQRPEIGTEQAAASGHAATFVRQVAGGDGPRGVDVAGSPAVEAPGQVRATLGYHEGQLPRLQRGDRHAMPVDGIEREEHTFYVVATLLMLVWHLRHVPPNGRFADNAPGPGNQDDSVSVGI